MGISHVNRIVTGIKLDYVQQDGLLSFLAEHGYTVPDSVLDRIEDEGWESFRKLMNVEFDIECMDGWSGHGWTIGIDGNDPASLKIMQDAFPNCDCEMFTYIQHI